MTVLLLALPALLRAQGTLSTQGYGYPGGQLSTRALGAGGATAEIDPQSATNPAALINFNGSALYFQAEPEYRTVNTGSASERSTVARYPLVTASIPFRSSIVGGITVSNLLDRSFRTSTRATSLVGTTAVASTNTFISDGAIGDLRLALAWAARDWLRVGIAGHAITGDNRLNSTQTFDDSVRYARVVDTSTVTFTGAAYSAGVQLVSPVAALAASYRRGGNLSVKHGDTTMRKATVPDRFAIGAAYLGIRGTTIGIRTAYDRWSNMRGLSSAAQPVFDGWDTSLGADILGPRLIGIPLQLRTGVRRRTLPFGLPSASSKGNDASVQETSASFGTGMLLSRGRAALDVTGVRSMRESAASPLRENAWTLSVGITVRP